MKHGVHQSETLHVGHELDAVKRLADLELLLGGWQIVMVVGLRLDVTIGVDQKAACADGRVLHALAGLRLDQLDHRFDERARCEVLAGAALGFFGVFLEQAFVQVAKAFVLGAVPIQAIDRFDGAVQVARLAERGRGVGEDGLHARRALAAEVEQ